MHSCMSPVGNDETRVRQVPLLFSFPRFRTGRFCHVYGRSLTIALRTAAPDCQFVLPARRSDCTFHHATFSLTLCERHFVNFLSFSRMIFLAVRLVKNSFVCCFLLSDFIIFMNKSSCDIFHQYLYYTGLCYKIGNSEKSKMKKKRI